MTLDRWQPVRLFLLGATLTGVMLILAKSIFYPTKGDRTISAFDFPETVPMTGWQLLESNPIKPNKDSLFLSGSHYLFGQNGTSLQMEIYYLTVDDQSGMHNFITKHGFGDWVPGKVTMQQNNNVGYYGFWETEEEVHLSGCISPYGGTTLTAEQYGQKQNKNALKISRIIPWAIGTESLRDMRCLWTNISVPIQPGESPEKFYPILENVWFSWYEWWQPRFPEARSRQ
jgi:cyanosortase A-associated protein